MIWLLMLHLIHWRMTRELYLIIPVATVIFFHALYGTPLEKKSMLHFLPMHCFIKLEYIILHLNLMHRALMLALLISMRQQEIMHALVYFIITMVYGMVKEFYPLVGSSKRKH